MNEIEVEPEAWLTMILRHVCHLLIILAFISTVLDVLMIPIERHLEEMREQSKARMEWLQSPIESR